MKPPRRSTVSPCPELPWFGHERHAPAGLLARGSLRRCPPSQGYPSGCGRWAAWTYARRSQLQGQPSSRRYAFRCVPVQPFRAPVRLKRDSNEVSLESFLNHFDEVKNGVGTRERVPNGVPIFDCDEVQTAQRTASSRRSAEQRGKSKSISRRWQFYRTRLRHRLARISRHRRWKRPWSRRPGRPP